MFPGDTALSSWKPIFSIADIGGSDSAATSAENEKLREARAREFKRPSHSDAIAPGPDGTRGDSSSGLSAGDLKEPVVGGRYNGSRRAAVVNGLNRPLFHIDLTGALQSAIANAKARDEHEGRGGDGIGEIP